MSKDSNVSVYLAGAMEAADHLGEGWRNNITPTLEELGFEVLDPCKLEADKLKNYRPNSKLLPFEHWRTGEIVVPIYWHHMKNAPIGSRQRGRFCTYMNVIKKFDLDIVYDRCDMVIVYWDECAARGAGTHRELDAAFEASKPVYAVCECDLPAWLAPCITAEFRNFKDLSVFLKEEFGDE